MHRDEPDHDKTAKESTLTREPTKGILKATRFTIPEENAEKRIVSIPFKDSIDEVVIYTDKSNLN